MSALRAATVAAFEALPGLVHGFEQPGGGRGESRDESRSRVGMALRPYGRLLLLRQVHGATVRAAPWADERPEGDASVCAAPGFLLGIETADCLPLLLVDPRRRAVAAVHAGWRGTVAGVARAAVDDLVAGGSRRGDLAVALGPAIGACCYEVGEELRAPFEAAFGEASAAFFVPGPRGRAHLDVRAANALQLERAGLRPERLHHVRDCTRCRADLYPSYRRDGAGAGRMISFIGFVGA